MSVNVPENVKTQIKAIVTANTTEDKTLKSEKIFEQLSDPKVSLSLASHLGSTEPLDEEVAEIVGTHTWGELLDKVNKYTRKESSKGSEDAKKANPSPAPEPMGTKLANQDKQEKTEVTKQESKSGTISLDKEEVNATGVVGNHERLFALLKEPLAASIHDSEGVIYPYDIGPIIGKFQPNVVDKLGGLISYQRYTNGGALQFLDSPKLMSDKALESIKPLIAASEETFRFPYVAIRVELRAWGSYASSSTIKDVGMVDKVSLNGEMVPGINEQLSQRVNDTTNSLIAPSSVASTTASNAFLQTVFSIHTNGRNTIGAFHSEMISFIVTGSVVGRKLIQRPEIVQLSHDIGSGLNRYSNHKIVLGGLPYFAFGLETSQSNPSWFVDAIKRANPEAGWVEFDEPGPVVEHNGIKIRSGYVAMVDRPAAHLYGLYFREVLQNRYDGPSLLRLYGLNSIEGTDIRWHNMAIHPYHFGVMPSVETISRAHMTYILYPDYRRKFTTRVIKFAKTLAVGRLHDLEIPKELAQIVAQESGTSGLGTVIRTHTKRFSREMFGQLIGFDIQAWLFDVQITHGSISSKLEATTTLIEFLLMYILVPNLAHRAMGTLTAALFRTMYAIAPDQVSAYLRQLGYSTLVDVVGAAIGGDAGIVNANIEVLSLKDIASGIVPTFWVVQSANMPDGIVRVVKTFLENCLPRVYPVASEPRYMITFGARSYSYHSNMPSSEIGADITTPGLLTVLTYLKAHARDFSDGSSRGLTSYRNVLTALEPHIKEVGAMIHYELTKIYALLGKSTFHVLTRFGPLHGRTLYAGVAARDLDARDARSLVRMTYDQITLHSENMLSVLFGIRGNVTANIVNDIRPRVESTMDMCDIVQETDNYMKLMQEGGDQMLPYTLTSIILRNPLLANELRIYGAPDEMKARPYRAILKMVAEHLTQGRHADISFLSNVSQDVRFGDFVFRLMSGDNQPLAWRAGYPDYFGNVATMPVYQDPYYSDAVRVLASELFGPNSIYHAKTQGIVFSRAYVDDLDPNNPVPDVVIKPDGAPEPYVPINVTQLEIVSLETTHGVFVSGLRWNGVDISDPMLYPALRINLDEGLHLLKSVVGLRQVLMAGYAERRFQLERQNLTVFVKKNYVPVQAQELLERYWDQYLEEFMNLPHNDVFNLVFNTTVGYKIDSRNAVMGPGFLQAIFLPNYFQNDVYTQCAANITQPVEFIPPNPVNTRVLRTDEYFIPQEGGEYTLAAKIPVWHAASFTTPSVAISRAYNAY